MIFSCVSSSLLIEKWNDPSFKSSSIRKMLVIAIRKNKIQRRIWEDAFIKELVSQNVAATASYSLFPNDLPGTNQILETVQKNNFDGILVSHTLPTETNLTYIEGNNPAYIQNYELITDYYIISGNAMLRYYHYWPRYYNHYYKIEHGYTNVEKFDRQCINVWTTGSNGHIIYSATSKTPDFETSKNAQYDISSLVVKDLIRNHVINKKRQTK